MVTGTPEGSLTAFAGVAGDPRTIEVDWDANRPRRAATSTSCSRRSTSSRRLWNTRCVAASTPAGAQYHLDGFLDPEAIPAPDDVRVIGMASAWIAGLHTVTAIRQLARLRCEVENASEFLIRLDLLVDEHSLVIAISRTGETADTLVVVGQASAAGRLGGAAATTWWAALPRRRLDAVLFMQSGWRSAPPSHQDPGGQIVVGWSLRWASWRTRRARFRSNGTAPWSPKLRRSCAGSAAAWSFSSSSPRWPRNSLRPRSQGHLHRPGLGSSPHRVRGVLEVEEVLGHRRRGRRGREAETRSDRAPRRRGPGGGGGHPRRHPGQDPHSIAEVRSRDAPVIALVTQGDDDVLPRPGRRPVRAPHPQPDLAARQRGAAPALRLSRRGRARRRRGPAAPPAKSVTVE